MGTLSELLKCCKTKKENAKSARFPSTGSQRINRAMQSVISSDIDSTHGCDKQDVAVAN